MCSLCVVDSRMDEITAQLTLLMYFIIRRPDSNLFRSSLVLVSAILVTLFDRGYNFGGTLKNELLSLAR